MSRLPIIRAFACADPLPGFEAAAHCFEERRRKDGSRYFALLPAVAHAATPEAAAEKLRAFWEDQIAKAEARSERGRALGKSRRKQEAA